MLEKLLTFMVIMLVAVCEAADMIMKFFHDRVGDKR